MQMDLLMLCKSLKVLNRSKDRLQYFKKHGIACHGWDEFNVYKTDLVVNTTSAGLSDENLPAPQELLEKILDQTSYVSDIIYGKTTPFLKLVAQKKIPYKDGLDMLVHQGALASYLFCDKIIPIDKITNLLNKAVLLK